MPKGGTTVIGAEPDLPNQALNICWNVVDIKLTKSLSVPLGHLYIIQCESWEEGLCVHASCELTTKLGWVCF